MQFHSLSVAVVTACAVAAPHVNPNDITHHDVDRAIAQISKELMNRFDPHNAWEPSKDDSGWLSRGYGGTTAVATLALLTANESQHSVEIKTALQKLESIRHPSTYTCSLRTMIWSELATTHGKQLRRDARRLAASLGRNAGGWGYSSNPPSTVGEASPTIRLFGTVALLEAHRKGVALPSACFASIASAVLQTQHEDGGWSHAHGKTAPNTTVAGFNCLLGVDEVLGEKLSATQKRILEQALQRALGWINTNYSPKHNPGGTAMMSYLCSLERAAMSCGLDQLRSTDWYREGVAAIINSHCCSTRVKGSTVNLSFALLFLTRGRVPLALVELQADKTTNDPYRLAREITQSVSNQIEQSLGWRVVTIDESIDRWLQAPLLLVQDISVLSQQTGKLRTYLDRGGLLLLVGEKNSAKQFVALADSLCPDAERRMFRTDHWGLDVVQNARGASIETWHDGIRDRVILLHANAKKISNGSQGQQLKSLVNICCGAAELGHWKTRMWSQEIGLDPNSFVIASHCGRWNMELHGLTSCGIESKSLTEAVGSRVVLVGGIDASEATPDLARQVIAVANAGTTLVIDTIGGVGGFASSLRAKIGDQISVVMESDRELLRQIKPVGVRGWTQLNHPETTPPLVANVGQGRIIFLDGDIHNALLGQPAWGVHGYDTRTAVALLQALVSNDSPVRSRELLGNRIR